MKVNVTFCKAHGDVAESACRHEESALASEKLKRVSITEDCVGRQFNPNVTLRDSSSRRLICALPNSLSDGD